MTESPQVSRRKYDGDLTDEDWAEIAPLVPTHQAWPNLQEPKHSGREMMNAIRYRTRTGVAWRSLPHDFPPWQTVARRYFTWVAAGVFDAIHAHLRTRVRVAEGRNPEPTVAILDSQSVKSTDVGGPCGFDGGKRGEGTKAPSARRRPRVVPRGARHAVRGIMR